MLHGARLGIMKTHDLLAETLALLRKSSETSAAIAAATGQNRYWVAKVRSGVIPNPGVQSVQRLHTYLFCAARARERTQARMGKMAAAE